MTPLTKTIKGNKFDEVFTEVAHTESLGLRNPEQLRLFHLDVLNNKFSSSELQKLLMRNIGRYVFSRAKLEKFRIDDDIDMISSQALRILQKSGGADLKGTGSELGEMLVYAFLEEKLEAPKLMSRVELANDAMQYGSGCDSIHLLEVDGTDAVPCYQLVFGASDIVGDMKDAIDCVFESILRIGQSEANEIQMVENTVLSRLFETDEIERITKILIPSPGNKSTCDTAFGAFLGYTLGLDPSGYSTIEFRKVLTQKMERDIQEHAAYIAKKIRDNHLDTHSFYFYVLPFNDAETEKKEIMGNVLKGDVAL
ncbi:hypothetical protein B1779_01105 [Dehalococcoides mccartyi]|uniref:HamA C-terminal domain-containing protein n=1 Tax=Dehalococcoides mccartyi TaxID=61435 RepID=UPI000995743E|nr:DUF1837 domain-containing protein [Dehalococcoides mccartyi]AQW61916.1 hypothetical protein B1779_01105 [Dehalococcoides mccartyi]